MERKVADVMWEMLAKAGVKRCYGIVGDALNPVIDALRRNGEIEFIHVRHEEYGVFAAVADSYLSGKPVAVCQNRRTRRNPSLQRTDGRARKEGACDHRHQRRCRELKLIDTAAAQRAEPVQIFRHLAMPLHRARSQSQFRCGPWSRPRHDGSRCRQGAER